MPTSDDKRAVTIILYIPACIYYWCDHLWTWAAKNGWTYRFEDFL